VRTKKKPRVAIRGWYGHKNTGDDALAATIAWGLHRFLGARLMDMMCNERLVLPENVPVRYLLGMRGLDRGQFAWRMIRADLQVIGGGSCLHDNRGVRALHRWLRFMRIGALLGHRTVGIGVSVGPVRTRAGRDALGRLLDRAALMWVRDQRSVDFARSLTPNAERNVFLGPDPAVLIDQVGLPEPHSLSRPDVPVLLVAPCNRYYVPGAEQANDMRRRRLAECLSHVCRQSNVLARFLVMNGGEALGDLLTCRILADDLPPGRAEIVDYDPNPLFAFRVIQESSLVVGVRLHSLIYAYTASVPFIALNYHVKVEDFVRSVGGAPECLFESHDFDPKALAARILESLRLPPAALLPTIPATESKQRATESFSRLAEFLSAT